MPAGSLDELVAQFDEAIEKVDGLILKHTEQGANAAIALVDVRLVETGKNAQGSSFEDYTPSYKKAKTNKGRYRGHVDFQDSTQMLASITTAFEKGDLQKQVKGGRAKVSFVARDETTRKKIEGNNKHRPGFLNPSAGEMKTVTRIANAGLSEDLAAIFQ